MQKSIPEISLQRLPTYLNYLKTLPEECENISSGAIARGLRLGEVLVRKDLAYMSAVGKPKVGYNKVALIKAIEEFLCFNSVSKAVIVGAGSIGVALMSYKGFSNYGIEIVCAFDNDSSKVGKIVADKPIFAINEVEERLKEYQAKLAIICVPMGYAQQVASILADAGIKAILNFAPVQIRVSEEIKVHNIDVAASLAILAREL